MNIMIMFVISLIEHFWYSNYIVGSNIQELQTFGKFNVLTQSCNTINMEGHIEVVVVKFSTNMVHNINYLRAKIFKYNSIC
jgi:hypothetical protein